MNDGTYRAKPMSGILCETKAGKEQVAISFEFLDEDYTGQTITYYGSFSEGAIEHTLRALRNCGWKGADLSALELDAPEVSLVIANESYEGKTTTKVKWVNAPGSVSVKAPLAADKAKAFAARMKGQVLAFDKSNGAPPRANNTAPGREPPPPNDSDRPPF